MTDQADTSPNAVFIGGCGRSGTTLLASALGCAAATVVTPESQFKQEMIRGLRTGRLAGDPASMYDWIDRDTRFKAVWQMKPERRLAQSPLVGAPALTAVVVDVVDQYAARHGAAQWRCWIDHTPENFREVATLMRMFPQLRFIHVVRDGRAAAASVLPLDWGPNDIIRAARWWTTEVALGLAMEATHPDRVMRVRYEDLTTDPETLLRAAAGFTGLAYDPRMLKADGFVLPGYTQGQHQLVGSAFDAGRNDGWKSALGPRQVEMFEATAGDLMDLLGYERQHRGYPRSPSAADRLKATALTTWRMAANRRRYSQRIRRSLPVAP